MDSEALIRFEKEFRNTNEGLGLFGGKCKKCGEIQFPPKTRCSACGGGEVERITIDETAELETFTVVHTPQKGFEAPYAVGFVRLSPGDNRAFTPLVTEDFESLEIGMPVELTTTKIRQRTDPVETWAFRPSRGGSS